MSRRKYPEPTDRLVPRKAAFRYRRNFRQAGRSFSRGNADCPQFSCSHEWGSSNHIANHHMNGATEQIGKKTPCPLVRDMRHVRGLQACHHLEKLAAKVAHAAISRGRHVDSAW